MAQKVDYHRYMASRAWALKRNAVRERSRGTCERCFIADMKQVHHLSYKNLGNEPMEELLGVCPGCHEYLSGVTDFDPISRWDSVIAGMVGDYGAECSDMDWFMSVLRHGLDDYMDLLTPTMRAYADGKEAGWLEGYHAAWDIIDEDEEPA